jgi:integrase
MAIVPRKTRYGARYTAVYRTTDKTQKSAGTFGTRKEAEAAYHDAMGKVLRGIDPSAPVLTVYPSTAGGQITVLGFTEPWIEKHDVSHNVRLTYKSCLKLHIIPRFGARPIGDVTTGELAEFLREIDKQDRPTLTAKVKAVLSAIFQAAAEDRNVPEVAVNPVRGIKLKRHARKRRLAFTHEEYEKLRAELDGHWHLLTDFITETGLRWEEAMGLKKSDIVNGVVWVGATLHEHKTPHEWVYQGRTKTGKGRQIKLRDSMAKRIAECPDGFLFLAPGGGHIRGGTFRRNVWHPALKAVGLEGSGLVPRDLRRTHATWLLDRGVPIEKISQRLGHTSIITTQIYLAVVPDSEDAVVAAIDW